MHTVSKNSVGLQYAARNNKQESPGVKVMMKSVIIGVILAVFITGTGILAGAWLLDQQWLAGGESQYVQMIWGITAVAVGGGAFYAAIRSGSAALWTSFSTAVLYILLRSLFSILYGDGTVLDSSGISLVILQTGVAVLCGMLGRKLQRQRS